MKKNIGIITGLILFLWPMVLVAIVIVKDAIDSGNFVTVFTMGSLISMLVGMIMIAANCD